MDNELSTLRESLNLLDVIPGEFKKVADTCGGEYAGPCPFCGGKDRFRIQPDFEGGRWFCRQCGDGYWHSLFDYIMHRDNVSFSEAVNKVKGLSSIEKKPLPHKEEPTIDRAVWVSRAYSFIKQSDENLKKPENSGLMKWLENRGLDYETLELFHIGANPTTYYEPAEKWGLSGNDVCLPAGIVIPCVDTKIHYVKIRRLPFTTGNKYHLIRGSHGWLFGGTTCQMVTRAVLYESELDAILGWKYYASAGHISIPAGQPMKIDYLPLLSSIDDVLVACDNDEAGQSAADAICKLQHFYKADKLPKGKDLTEFHQQGGNVFDYLRCQLEKIPGGDYE